jgi:hypothetical protein
MTASRRHVLLAAAALVVTACSHAGAAPPPRLQLRAAASDERLVLDGQVRAVRIVRDPERDGIALSVDLDDATRKDVASFTGRNVGRRVEIVVAGNTVATLTVRDPVDVPSLLLTATDDASVRRMTADLEGR